MEALTQVEVGRRPVRLGGAGARVALTVHEGRAAAADDEAARGFGVGAAGALVLVGKVRSVENQA